MDNYKYIVCTRCMTYNQASYIIDAMNGFGAQETDFPFVNVIVDDASTDGEQEVISNYIQNNFNMRDRTVVIQEETEDYNLIYAQHNKNKNCFFAVYFLKANHFSIGKSKRPYFSEIENSAKYIAYCEGDDYWTDPRKLQKQVDFLDTHTEYSFCCHRFTIYEQNHNIYRKEYGYDWYKDGQDLEITEQVFLNTWVTQILTTMIRQDAYINAVQTCGKLYNSYRDDFLFYELLQKGKGISLNQNMGIYRWNDGGIVMGQTILSRFTKETTTWSLLYKHHPEDKLLLPKIRYYYNRLLRFSSISKDGFLRLKDSYTYCTTFGQKVQMTIMYIIPPYIIKSLSNLYVAYLRKKCSISNPL